MLGYSVEGLISATIGAEEHRLNEEVENVVM